MEPRPKPEPLLDIEGGELDADSPPPAPAPPGGMIGAPLPPHRQGVVRQPKFKGGGFIGEC